MKVTFCHHLSLAYQGGGEKWIVNTAKALQNLGHDVSVYALPFLLEGKRKVDPNELLGDIPYHEGVHHRITGDVAYVTYHPFSAASFKTDCPKVAGLHSETYWHSPHLQYGALPVLANVVNRFVSYGELRTFKAIHRLNSLYPVNHPKVYTIPNYVDSTVYRPLKKSDEFTVAYASRRVWQKGYDIFRKIERHLGCRVKVSGDVVEDRMPEFLSDAHVVVAPSRVDTFGLSLVEAAMCGTAVITSPLASHRCLGLPFRYATSPAGYLGEVNCLKKEPDFGLLSSNFRSSALRYDKAKVIYELEKMLLEVAND